MSHQPRSLNITASSHGDVPVVHLVGEIDLQTSPELRTTLLQWVERRPRRLILDLAGVSYVDSSGVGTFVDLKRKLERVGGRVVLVGLQQRVRSVFEITRLDRFFTLAESIDEAAKA